MASATSPLPFLRYGFASLVTGTFAYGLYVSMSAMTWYHLRAPAARQGRRFIMAYTAAMFGLTFAMYLSSAMMLEAAMIEAPADTLEASGTLICGPWSITNTVVSTLQFLLSDALLVYRTYILFRSQKAFMIPPFMLWLGLAGLSILVFVTTCGLEVVDGGPANIPLYFNTTTAWYAVTATLQVLTTGMIAFKLLQHRRALNKHGLAASANGLGYISLASILTESAILYTIATAAFIPMIRLNIPVQIWWGQVVNSLAFLNPAFIILRVVTGQSYTAVSTSSPHSALPFAARSIAGQGSTVFSTKTVMSREADFRMSFHRDVAKQDV